MQAMSSNRFGGNSYNSLNDKQKKILSFTFDKHFQVKKIVNFVAIAFTVIMVAFFKQFKVAYHESISAYKFAGKTISASCAKAIHTVPSFFEVENYSVNSLTVLTSEYIEGIILQNNSGRFYDINRIFKDLNSNSLISNVSIARNIVSRSMKINIKEKKLVGVLTKPFEGDYAIDENGDLHKCDESITCNNLPKVYGDNYKSYANLYSYFNAANLHSYIESMFYISDRRWNIRLQNGLLIKMPAQNLQQAVDKLVYFNQGHNIFQNIKNIMHIDLRIDGKVFVLPREDGNISELS